MVNNIISILWNCICVLFQLSVIVFLATFIINLITNFIDERKRKKAANEALQQLQDNFNDLMKALQQEEKKKSTKKLDNKSKE